MHMRLLLSKLGRRRAEMDRLAANYRERTKVQKVAIRVKFETNPADARVSKIKYPEILYPTPVVFACFVCALFSFCACEFSVKSEKIWDIF